MRVAADHVVIHRQAFRDRKDPFEHAAEKPALSRIERARYVVGTDLERRARHRHGASSM